MQASPEFCSKIQEACTKMSLESGETLKELASGIRAMTQPSSAYLHISKAKIASKNLKSLLKSSFWDDDANLLAVIPAVTVASLLIDIVDCTEKIVDSVHELASLAHFKGVDLTVGQGEQDKQLSEIDCPQAVITIDGPIPALPENGKPPPAFTDRHTEM